MTYLQSKAIELHYNGPSVKMTSVDVKFARSPFKFPYLFAREIT